MCPETECNRLGKCIGNPTSQGIQPAVTAEQCLLLCQADPECLYSTFYGDEEVCALLSSCSMLDTTCLDCTSNNAECEPDGAGLFVV